MQPDGLRDVGDVVLREAVSAGRGDHETAEPVDDLVPGGSGVRAQALTPDGKLVQDFVIRETARALHLLNAPSPGATASLAIADTLVSRIAS